jgi:actin-related protein 8
MLLPSSRDYLKRDDQILAYRLQNEEARNRMAKAAKDRDRSLAMSKTEAPLPDSEAQADGDPMMADADEDEDEEEEEEPPVVGSKTLVMHVGSQYLRIGLASDALPKTVPMVIARRAPQSESEENGGEPRPKRLKLDDGQQMEPEKMFGPEVRTFAPSRMISFFDCPNALTTYAPIVCRSVHDNVR